MKRYVDVPAGRFSRVSVYSLIVVAALAASASSVAAHIVPTQFQGKWVPTKATCESPVRMQVAAGELTLVNGTDTQGSGGIDKVPLKKCAAG